MKKAKKAAWIGANLLLWMIIVIQKPTVSFLWRMRRHYTPTKRRKKCGRKKNPTDKYQAYVLRNRRSGKCVRCGKPCAPFSACAKCRAYKARHCYESYILRKLKES